MPEEYLTSYGEHYFEISVKHFKEFWEFNEKLKSTWSKIDEISKRYETEGDDEDSKEIEKLLNIAAGFRNDRDASGHVSIIFSAMCLETIINHYAIARSSIKYFRNYLDKLDVKAKWVTIPKLFSNVEFNRDSQAFELLAKLITMRNELVHFKPKKIEYTFTLSDEVRQEEDEFVIKVQNSIKTMILVIDELKRIDDNWTEFKWYLHLQKEYSEILKNV